MCDFFWQRMEDDQGDLADIVRAGGHGLPATGDFPVASWQLPGDSMSFPQLSSADGAPDDFGDPFASFQDPLLGELRAVEFFDAADAMPGGGDGDQVVAGKCLIGEEMQKPCCGGGGGGGGGIFSRMLQISPDAAKAMRAIRPSPVVMAAGEMVRVGGGAEHVAGMQISSPRTLGIKRRKSQPKKVICIPAPPAAAAGSNSNRPGGDVVPSDLWAWRKYGQKPIKGSPYPRGYYRCSSSKGCSARKQVERSRTDPNMLVITYTSEHNHPWPTQRNALAGSTKSKNNNSSKIFHKSPGSVKAEAREEAMTASSGIISPLVKEEEIGELIDHKAIDAAEESGEFNSQMFDHQSYKPMIPDSNQSDDFFADLAELEADPMSLIFSKDFLEERKGEKACLDAFNVFDWGSSSFGEAKKGL